MAPQTVRLIQQRGLQIQRIRQLLIQQTRQALLRQQEIQLIQRLSLTTLRIQQIQPKQWIIQPKQWIIQRIRLQGTLQTILQLPMELLKMQPTLQIVHLLQIQRPCNLSHPYQTSTGL